MIYAFQKRLQHKLVFMLRFGPLAALSTCSPVAAQEDCDPAVKTCKEPFDGEKLLQALGETQNEIEMFLYIVAGFLIAIFGLFAAIKISRKLLGAG